MRPLDPALLPYLRPARRSLAGVVAAGVVGGLLTVAQAFALGTLLVRLVSDPGGTAWHASAGWLVAIVAARAGESGKGFCVFANVVNALCDAFRVCEGLV
uniref:hypothetical protein n=1 Tax=uncultured Paracoccus sp. TaxID=189685 RepID=UPI00351A9EBC